MGQNFYVDSMPYEWFMRRALRDITKTGVKNAYMQNLMWAEIGSSNVSHLGSYDKQLKQVKGYLNKAIDKYLKHKLTPEEKEQFLIIRQELETAYSTKELMQIINKGVELTERFKNF